ncbi:recombinase RecT [Flavobacterium agricola]|uniref:Recombinase RecT n=1 Tax=Flavobacterium agricola TaxID=2870839 RepID=A0ABY6M0Q8_9FLAO|nr:recombinase RecT [Flavobacterium agricola]UYW02084.1 recombinase RecT [Flavobacterium agricola]
MTNQVTTQQQNKPITVKGLFNAESTKKRFEELLGKKAQGFISSVIQITNNNKLLANANPTTILNSAVMAAALDLPINQNLGFAWIIPFKGEAQFQMGWKGYIQLAIRTGQYKSINVIEVYENQYKKWNALTEELDADFDIDGAGEVIGYVAYFKLITGFEKTIYWSKDKVKKHASKYSQTYGKKTSQGKLMHSPWNDADQFDEMAKKTLVKQLISKWGIMSIELNKAVESDQAVIEDDGNYKYVDNETVDIQVNEEVSRALEFMNNINTAEDLKSFKESISQDLFVQIESDITEKENQLLFNQATAE